MSKKSFKPTPIPYFSKFGKPMVYYILSEDGKQETKVTRAECLARTDEPGIELPQRWYVDEEAGLVVRLPRNQMGEDLARDNMRFIWREAKHIERNCSCVLKGTDKCEGWKPDADGFVKCDCCQRPNRSRTVELDMYFRRENGGNGDNMETRYEPADPNNLESVMEEKGDVAELAADEQRNAMENDDREGLVAAYLETLLPEDWDTLDIYRRQEYFRSPDDPTRVTGVVRREQVSNIEIWCECFGRSRDGIKKSDSYEIEAIIKSIGGWERYTYSKTGKKNIPIYGIQRVYVRAGEANKYCR